MIGSREDNGRPVPGQTSDVRGHDSRARLARRRRLLAQVDEALQLMCNAGTEDVDWSVVATTLGQVRNELCRDLSGVDVDAVTEPHFAVVRDVGPPP